MKVKVTYGDDTKAASNINTYQALKDYIDASFKLQYSQYGIYQKIENDKQVAQQIELQTEQDFLKARKYSETKGQTCQRVEVQLKAPELLDNQQQQQVTQVYIGENQKFQVEESSMIDQETKKQKLAKKAMFLEDNDEDLAQSTMFEVEDLQHIKQLNMQQNPKDWQKEQQQDQNDNFESIYMSSSDQQSNLMDKNKLNNDSMEEYKDAIDHQQNSSNNNGQHLIHNQQNKQQPAPVQNSFMLTPQEQNAIDYTGFMDQIFDTKHKETMSQLLQMGYTDYQKNFALVQQQNNSIDKIVDILSQQ